MALDEAFNAILAGVRDRDRSAICIFARAAELIRGPWADALSAYPAPACLASLQEGEGSRTAGHGGCGPQGAQPEPPVP